MNENEIAIAVTEGAPPEEKEPVWGEADAYSYKGNPLNTSASRFAFIDGLLDLCGGQRRTKYSGETEQAAVVVFTCLLAPDEFKKARRIAGWFDDRLIDWMDDGNLSPTNLDGWQEVITLAGEVFAGWFGTMAEPDGETDDVKGDPPGKASAPE